METPQNCGVKLQNNNELGEGDQRKGEIFNDIGLK